MEIKLKLKREIKTGIIISDNIDIEKFIKGIEFDKGVVITDKIVCKKFKKFDFMPSLILNPERSKSFNDLKNILNFFLNNNLTRRSIAIALGGGRISDLTSLASSLYLRGIRWISFPTTFLAQIDAAIGGKNAIDFKAKNIIGDFHHPSYILIDPSVISKTQIKEGIGELIKYAIISDPLTSRKLKRLLPEVKEFDRDAIKKAIILSVLYKTKIVEKDPFDELGIRERLNFGHTFGHAVEILYKIPHGNAITIGMNFALNLSRNIKILTKNYDKLTELLSYDSFRIKLNKNDFKKILKLISMDKKNKGYSNYFLLINDKMELKGFKDIDNTILKEVWDRLCQKYS